MEAGVPHIGITGPSRGGGALWRFAALAVWRAGGKPLRITPEQPLGDRRMHGLILGGGADVDPVRYGEERIVPNDNEQPFASLWRHPLGLLVFPVTFASRLLAAHFGSSRLDHERDHLEFSTLERAVEQRLPVLGICRGEQLLNVFFNGSLHQSLTGFYIEEPEVRTILPRKSITVMPGTHLARVLGPAPHRVNALHRQGVNRLGDGIVVAARDRNGIVQAIEHKHFPFLIGVQWHPEYLPHIDAQQRLFRALVREARRSQPA